MDDKNAKRPRRVSGSKRTQSVAFPPNFAQFSDVWKYNSHQRQWRFRKHQREARRFSHMKSLFPESRTIWNFPEEIACTSSGNLSLWERLICSRIDVRKLICSGYFFPRTSSSSYGVSYVVFVFAWNWQSRFEKQGLSIMKFDFVWDCIM